MADLPITIAAIIKDFFGLRPGTTNGDFLKEFRELPEADRLWMAREIAKQRGLHQGQLAFPLA